MKLKESKLIWLLLGVLAVSLLVGLLTDPNTWSAIQPSGEYHVQISEICAKNETVIADNDGKYRDYIEIYNAGETVDLTGCRLTDGSNSATPFEGMRLGAGEYRVIFIGGDTTGFALSASGKDSIQLQDPNGHIIAQAKLRSMLDDQVMVLRGGAYYLNSEPTPGFSNDSTGRNAFLKGAPADKQSLQLSEVLIANRATLPDERGQYSDVVELHNIASTPVSLGGWCLSDDLRQRFLYRLPEVIVPADGYVVIHCDGENYVSDEGFIHANFGLSLGEELCLTDPAGGYVTIKPQHPAENVSLALTEEGYVAMAPSLGFPNTEEGAYNARAARVDPDSPLVISEVLLSDAGVPWDGRFADAVEIYNRSDRTVSLGGWYLSDGGDPHAYAFPKEELKPGEYKVICISQQTTGFGLSVGETLYLIGPEHLWSQPVDCVQPTPGCSISLVDQTDLSYEFSAVTLGYDNQASSTERYLAGTISGSLRISEVMSSNSTYLRGPYGNATDWVELYNAGKTSVKLSDYYLTDSDDLDKYQLPNKTLAPGKYIVILLSETGKRLKTGYSWLPFSLAASGDRLYLTKDGRIEDHVVIPDLPSNTAWGRPSKKLAFSQLASPSPGSANGAAAKISATPVADVPQGAYDDVNTLTISFSAPGDIYYTTDCSIPTRDSKRYTGPLRISRTTVFRVAAFEKGSARSQVVDLTYLINEGDNLSTVCLVTDPENLWNYHTGIYVMGPNAGATNPYHGANFWANVEKEASVSLFETDGSVGFTESCGLKIFGGYSRANSKKSFACMFRGKYGTSSLEYALFGEQGIDSYQSFVLRAGGQDAYTSKIRDEMITSLASEFLGLPVQRYRPIVLYLNGEYWGIYFIREKLTDQYVAGNYGVYAEDVTLSNWSGSTCPEYTALQTYARTHDLSKQTHYQYVCSRINVENYTDYVITQMWIANTDLGNVKFFKTNDMRWQWALFDTDLSFRRVSHPSVTKFLSKNIYKRDICSATLAIRLMKNDSFRDTFLRRMAWQLKNVWTEEHVVARVDAFQALLQADMAKECDRWGGSVTRWENNLQALRDFAAKRTKYFLQDVQDYFGLSDKQMRSYGFEV